MADLKDSGARKEFSSGAVRDISEGKGRCDLLPLDVMSGILQGYECWHQEKEESTAPMPTTLRCVGFFVDRNNVDHLFDAISSFIDEAFGHDIYTALLELAKHYEDGARKYADNNWKLGIDLHCFVDSAVRHYIKWLRGDNDEPHDRAVLWNLVGAIWTYEHKPELDDIHVECELQPNREDAEFLRKTLILEQPDPQYEDKFQKTISADTWAAIQKEATAKIKEADEKHKDALESFVKKYPDYRENPAIALRQDLSPSDISI